MEVNGVANILSILYLAELDQKIDPSVIAEIEYQCNVLDHYLQAYDKAIQKGKKPPYWHEIREKVERGILK